MTLADYRKAIATKGKKQKCTRRGQKRRSPLSAPKRPNKTEAEYNALYLAGNGLYEAVSFHLDGGSRYTPDWVTFDKHGRMTCHEVKGAYRFASESRAVMAVRECIAKFPAVRFVWAKKTASGKWEVFEYEGGKHEKQKN